MNEEEFNKEFPSLNQDEELGWNLKELIIGDYGEQQWIIALSETCLDKKRVKEAIMRLPDDNRRHILLKELGIK